MSEKCHGGTASGAVAVEVACTGLREACEGDVRRIIRRIRGRFERCEDDCCESFGDALNNATCTRLFKRFATRSKRRRSSDGSGGSFSRGRLSRGIVGRAAA